MCRLIARDLLEPLEKHLQSGLLRVVELVDVHDRLLARPSPRHRIS